MAFEELRVWWRETTQRKSQADRIEDLLERVVEALEDLNDRAGYDSALERWRLGQGKHPDD